MAIQIRLSHDVTGLISAAALELADKVVRKTAFDIEAEAKQDCPVDTGYLKSSIQMVDDKTGDAQAEVRVGADYGAYVEFGTTRQHAQPYLTPAVEHAKPAFVAAMKQILNQ